MSKTAPGACTVVLRFVTDWPRDDVAADRHADALSDQVRAAFDALPFVYNGSTTIRDLDGGADVD